MASRNDIAKLTAEVDALRRQVETLTATLDDPSLDEQRSALEAEKRNLLAILGG